MNSKVVYAVIIAHIGFYAFLNLTETHWEKVPKPYCADARVRDWVNLPGFLEGELCVYNSTLPAQASSALGKAAYALASSALRSTASSGCLQAEVNGIFYSAELIQCNTTCQYAVRLACVYNFTTSPYFYHPLVDKTGYVRPILTVLVLGLIISLLSLSSLDPCSILDMLAGIVITAALIGFNGLLIKEYYIY